MRGRKPKPVEQKIREGNPGRRPLPAPLLVGGRPELQELAEPPEHIGDDGREWWATEVPVLAEAGIIDRIDRRQLEMLATTWDDYAKARRVLAVDGFFVRGSVGQLREHPAMKIAREATHTYDKLAEHFGMNPMARTRLGVEGLRARSLAQEMTDLDKPAPSEADADIPDAEVVDDDSVGVPGL